MLTSIASADRATERPRVISGSVALPSAPLPASVTLPRGTFAAGLTTEINLSRDNVLAPVSLGPDLAYGVSDRFTIAVIHSAYAMTGFRGSAGFGLCLTGEMHGCRTLYSNGGIEALYRLSQGAVALAADAGLLLTTFDPVHTDLKLGLKLKLSEGRTYALVSPSVWIALDDRYDRVIPHENQLWVPISLWHKVDPDIAVGIGSGIKGPLKRFQSRLAMPLGVLAQFSITPNATIGASLVFGKLIAGGDVMEAGPGSRVVQIWINVTAP